MLSDLLRAKIDYFLYDLFWILVSRQLIDFFLYARLIWEVGVDIGSRNVSEGLNFPHFGHKALEKGIFGV